MSQTKNRSHHRHSFVRRHSLSIVAVGMLAAWIVLYYFADPKTHLGSFFGNAIADWSGSVIIIIGTKFLVEYHSAESRSGSGNRAVEKHFLKAAQNLSCRLHGLHP